MHTAHLFGLDMVSRSTIDELADLLATAPCTQGPSVVVTPNVRHIVHYERDPTAAMVARSATLVLPDGAPIVWASRLLGRPLKHRLAGSDLFPALWDRLAATDRPVVVVAANEQLAAASRLRYPSARVLTAAPDLGTAASLDGLCGEIERAVHEVSAGYLVLAIGLPATHHIAAALTSRQRVADGVWVLAVGAAVEFHLGLKRRAPRWMRRAGLEWAHRLSREPRRLWRRYLFDGLPFLVLVWRERSRGKGS